MDRTDFMRGLTRLRRAMYRGRNSSPLLSGDALASVCDVYVDRPLSQMPAAQLRKIYDANAIFCKSDHFDELLSESARLSARFLLAGNSDVNFHSEPQPRPKRLRAMLLQNSFVSDNKRIFTIPIGIENLALGANGMTRFFTQDREDQKLAKVLVGPFSPTHPIREGICDRYQSTTGPWDVYESRLSPAALGALMKRYRWVMCPRGNGVDTHRVWEALYRGAVPVVSDPKWSASLRVYGYPMVIEPSFDPQVVAQGLIRDASFPETTNPRRLSWLWIPQWADWIHAGGDSPGIEAAKR